MSANTRGGFILRGAVAGAIGAWVMDRVTWFIQDRQTRWAIQRERAAWPLGLDVSHGLAYRLARTVGWEPERTQPSTAGMLAHYMLSVGPALLYAALREHDPRFSADRGLLYGFTIFVLWDELLSTATGLAGPPRAYPWQAHARGLLGHLALGAATHVALTALETDFGVRPIEQHPGA
jgi:hypothetical protein